MLLKNLKNIHKNLFQLANYNSSPSIFSAISGKVQENKQEKGEGPKMDVQHYIQQQQNQRNQDDKKIKEIKAIPEKLEELMRNQQESEQELNFQHILGSTTSLQKAYYEKLIYKAFQAYTHHHPYPNSVFNEKLYQILKKLNFDSSNTLFGSSICPDELNHGHSSLANLMKNTWGDIMPFGGLGGIPFAGKTGFNAYASHVPDDGHLLVLFAPHVGIDKLGKLGYVERKGQKNKTPTCGAASGAFLHALENSHHTIDAEHDYQIDWISKKMIENIDRIKNAEDQMAEVTEIMYQLVEQAIFKIANTDFGSGKLILVGGIQINVGYGEDFFLPRLLQIHQKGQEPVDLSELL